MDTPRPGYDDPAQAEWDARYEQVLAALNVKIKEYNAAAEAYNHSIGAIESAKIKLYTIIRTRTYTSEEKVETSRAAVITSGGNMTITGSVRNTDSQITAGKTLTFEGGSITNDSKQNQTLAVTFGTTQESYTKKKKWPHKAWRRHYREEIFMTPQKTLGNTERLGVDEWQGDTSLNPFLDPDTQKPSAAGGSAAGDHMTLPDSAIYHINDDSTSKYVVETDPAFTNKHNFLSSDYMYEQMKWDPDKVAKRLGDGFYEQELIRQQITSLTGKRYLGGYESEEEEYKALMDAGVAYAREQGLTPGIALTGEQIAALTSDIVWLETTTVTVNGKDIDVVYPHVYLRANGDMTLSKDGSLMSGKSLVIDTKQEIENTGALYGDTVIAKGGSITNRGRIEGGTVDLSAIRDIHEEGLILGGSGVSLTAGGNISMGNTVVHGKNQDILSTTAGIAVKDNEGVLLLSAGKDLCLTGATLANLGEKAAPSWKRAAALPWIPIPSPPEKT